MELRERDGEWGDEYDGQDDGDNFYNSVMSLENLPFHRNRRRFGGSIRQINSACVKTDLLLKLGRFEEGVSLFFERESLRRRHQKKDGQVTFG